MPLTSSVFPLPRSPSSPTTSPASRALPRRRPSWRVSSTDRVSTEVLIASCPQAFDPPAVFDPDAGPRVDLTDNRQRKLEAFEGLLGREQSTLWRGADQLEVLGIAHRQRPLLPLEATPQWQALDIDRRAEALRLHQSLDLTMQAVADVATDPDPGLDQRAAGGDAWQWIELGGHPFALDRGGRLRSRFEKPQSGRGAAERAGDRDQPAGSGSLSPEHRPSRSKPANQCRRQRQRSWRLAEVSPSDPAAVALGLLRDAAVEPAHVGDGKRPAQGHRDERIARLCAHRRQVAEVDCNEAAAEGPEIESRPPEAESGAP